MTVALKTTSTTETVAAAGQPQTKEAGAGAAAAALPVVVLRPYQREMLREVWREAQRAQRLGADEKPLRVACVQPTGAGKTVEILTLVNQLAKDMNWRCLVVVSTRRLVKQTIEKASVFYPQLKSGVISEGKWNFKDDDRLVVATAAGISGKKLQKFKRNEFQLVIMDEAHHTLANSWLRVLEYFDRAKLLVGLTATFRRGDGESILSEKYFSTLLVWHTVAQLTEAGYLSPARGSFVYTETSLANVKRTKDGDYDEKALAKVVDTPQRNAVAVQAWLEQASDVPGGRATVCFGASINHAKHLAEEFILRGVPAAAVWGAQDLNEQNRIFEDYRAGKIKVLTNAMLLTEGWDEPVTSCVLIARPATVATSFVLGPQMIGRGLRLFPNKRDALIIELRDRAEENDTSLLAATMELEEKEIKPGVPLHLQKQQKEKKRAEEEIEYLAGQIGEVQFASELFNVIEKLEKASRMAWLPLGSRLYMSLSGKDFLEIVEESEGRFAVNAVESGRLKTLKIAATREKAMQLGENWIIANGRDHTLVRRDAEWRKKPVTSAAISRANKLTGRPKNELKRLNRGELSDLINAALALKKRNGSAAAGER